MTAKRDKNDVKDEIRTALVSAFVTCVICGLIALYSDRSTTTIFVMICCVGALLLLAALIAFLRFRRKDTLTSLTREGVMDVLRFEGYYPYVDDEGDLIFKINGETYVVDYDRAIFSLSYRGRVSGNEQQIRDIAMRVSDGIIISKIIVHKLPQESDNLGVDIRVDACSYYAEDLRKTFPIMMDILRETISRFAHMYNELNDAKGGELARRDDIYQPEFRWLPDVVFKAVREGNLVPEALTDEDWLRQNIMHGVSSKDIAKEWESFRINRVETYGDYKLIVYQFPEPKITPEAKYGVVLMNTKSLEIDYYTLEMTYNNKWVYGSMTSERHINYGEVESPDLELFIEWVFSNDKQIVASRDYTEKVSDNIN